MQRLIRLVYALFIAASLITFVVMGMDTVYTAPKYPSYDYSYIDSTLPDYTKKYDAQQKQETEKRDAYDKENRAYQKKIAITALPISAIVVAIGVYLYKKNKVIGEGIALGGAGAAIYAIYSASQSQVKILTFLSISILLATSILVAWRQFGDQTSSR